MTISNNQIRLTGANFGPKPPVYFYHVYNLPETEALMFAQHVCGTVTSHGNGVGGLQYNVAWTTDAPIDRSATGCIDLHALISKAPYRTFAGSIYSYSSADEQKRAHEQERRDWGFRS